MYVTRCATLALLRPPVACLCADGNFCTIAPPNELAPSLIGCGIRPCLPATIPVFQLFDAPRADGTHPLTRSCASPKELIDESDVLSLLWSVFPLTAARSLPQELHTLLGMCLRVAMAKSGMLREPCGALWGVVLLGPPAWPAWPPSCCRRRCVFPALAMRWGPEDLDQPNLPQRFPKVRTRATAGWCKSPSPPVVLG